MPFPRGQAEVTKNARRDSGAVISRLRYAGMHSSGTPICDALELEGIALVANESGRSEEAFVVGSTQGNTGNTKHASGLVSLAKMFDPAPRGSCHHGPSRAEPHDQPGFAHPIGDEGNKTSGRARPQGGPA